MDAKKEIKILKEQIELLEKVIELQKQFISTTTVIPYFPAPVIYPPTPCVPWISPWRYETGDPLPPQTIAIC